MYNREQRALYIHINKFTRSPNTTPPPPTSTFGQLIIISSFVQVLAVFTASDDLKKQYLPVLFWCPIVFCALSIRSNVDSCKQIAISCTKISLDFRYI
jgi:hypothetical protein